MRWRGHHFLAPLANFSMMGVVRIDDRRAKVLMSHELNVLNFIPIDFVIVEIDDNAFFIPIISLPTFPFTKKIDAHV